MSSLLGHCSLLILSPFLLAGSAYADTVTLLPVADTTLFEQTPNNNLGANSTLAAGTTAGVSGPAAASRALLRFDVAASIPTNAYLTSASVTIKVTKAPVIPSRFDFRPAAHAAALEGRREER